MVFIVLQAFPCPPKTDLLQNNAFGERKTGRWFRRITNLATNVYSDPSCYSASAEPGRVRRVPEGSKTSPTDKDTWTERRVCLRAGRSQAEMLRVGVNRRVPFADTHRQWISDPFYVQRQSTAPPV
jgi:hypothetical protein